VRAPVQKALETLKAAQQPLFKELKGFEEQLKKGPLSDVDAARKRAVEAEVIGNSLDARATLSVGRELAAFVDANKAELAELLIVSQVDVRAGGATLEVTVAPARGERCARCWCYTEARGSDARHPELCPKRTGAVVADFPDGLPTPVEA